MTRAARISAEAYKQLHSRLISDLEVLDAAVKAAAEAQEEGIWDAKDAQALNRLMQTRAKHFTELRNVEVARPTSALSDDELAEEFELAVRDYLITMTDAKLQELLDARNDPPSDCD